MPVTSDLLESPPGRASALFAATSGGAVIVGCIVAAAHSVPAAVWTRNAGVWIVGALIAIVIARTVTQRVAQASLLLAAAVMAATLLSGGLSGVHRWIGVGPLRFNAAELFLPMAIVSWADVIARRRPLWIAAPVIAIILAIQPDASQAAALASAVIAVLLAHRSSNAFRLTAASVPVAAALIAVLRPDPLQPVPEVEGVIGLALDTSPLMALLAVLTLAGAVLSPLAVVPSQTRACRAMAIGLAVYFAISALSPWVGAFPVPLVGMGVSPILGAWCGMGLLAGLSGRRAAGEVLVVDHEHRPDVGPL